MKKGSRGCRDIYPQILSNIKVNTGRSTSNRLLDSRGRYRLTWRSTVVHGAGGSGTTVIATSREQARELSCGRTSRT
jgi:hypothetical protein